MYNKVRNSLVANRSVFKLFLTELNPTILKILQTMYSIKSNHTENISDNVIPILKIFQTMY